MKGGRGGHAHQPNAAKLFALRELSLKIDKETRDLDVCSIAAMSEICWSG
jgi:hypothetical protein